MQESHWLLQHTAIYGCLDLTETVLETFVSLMIPAGKRRHIRTGELKELNKGIIGTGLRWGQRAEQGWSPRPGGSGGGMLPKCTETSYWDRVSLSQGCRASVEQPSQSKVSLAEWCSSHGSHRHTGHSGGTQAGREGGEHTEGQMEDATHRI